AEKLAQTNAQRTAFIERFNAPIIKKLHSNGISFEISGRVKSIYSIWKKMKLKGITFDDIYDLFAIRIIFNPSEQIPEKSQCWHIYSLITDIYKPKTDRIRDWVNTPKANGYEALHCTVMGPDGTWAEVQIRSTRMNDIAERGFAAHWAYKSKQSGELGELEDGDRDNDIELDQWLGKLREALNNPAEDAVEFLDNFKMNLQVSEIMVFTPAGDSRTMPKGATALDFAYDVHSKIGNSALGAKINNKLVTLFTEINAGDQIEILTSPSVVPSPVWLSHVTTAKAKTHIKQYLKRDKESCIKAGQQLFEAEMKKEGITLQARVFRKVLPAYNCGNKDEFYSKLGAEIINLDGIDKILRQNSASKLMKYWTLQLTNTFGFGGGNSAVKKSESSGSADFIIAECCRPIPGDVIIGFKQEDGQVVVHKKKCPMAVKISAQHGNTIVPAQWSSEKVMSYLTVLSLRGIDRMGIMLDLAQVISGELNVNIREIEFHSHDGIFDGKISLYVRGNDDLKIIMQKVSQIKGVEKILRIESENVN
ncbi:MAG: ACT domain-containing protein, partial [Mucinivorans sp.]